MSTLQEDNTLLAAEIEILQSQLTEHQHASEQTAILQFNWEYTQLELLDAERDTEGLHARVRWLESELAGAGVYVAGQPTPAGDLPTAPANLVDVIELARTHLDRLVIGDTDDAAADLDVHPPAERWAAKVWNALIALNAYASARAAGDWSNSFMAWCQDTPSGQPMIAASWIAMKESETTNSMPRLREARTFRVPRSVDSSGRVYMPAHIKIAQGGTPCPRIHFHDDAGAGTGKVYIGYVGDHLPTAGFS